MHEIQIERRFFAAHALRLYDGSMEPLHAHDWVVQVQLRAEALDAMEVVMDFHALEKIVSDAIDPLRDANLNEHALMANVNPSAERIAEILFHAIASKLPEQVMLAGVTITESPGCRATHRP